MTFGDKTEASWEVATVINEPLSTALKFVSWHLQAGAELITLYFDNPQDPAITILEGLKRIKCVKCTDEFWADRAIAPDRRFTLRQNVALTHAYKNATADWFACLDADEFFYFREAKIGSLLADQDQDVLAIHFPTAEKIQTLGQPDGQDEFRLPMSLEQTRAVYRGQKRFFKQRSGLVGHDFGKSITRTGLKGVWVRQHWLERKDRSVVSGVNLGANSGGHLLHFFDQGFDRWLEKSRWRAFSRGFKGPVMRQIRGLIEQEASREEFLELYKNLHCVDAERLQRMKDNGVHLSLNLCLDELVEEYFPGVMQKSEASQISLGNS